jgi:hypothetical protein
MVLGTIHIITDWLLLLLPIPVVWRLCLGLRAKISISALFAVGGAVCVISIIRVRKSHELNGVDPTCRHFFFLALPSIPFHVPSLLWI